MKNTKNENKNKKEKLAQKQYRLENLKIIFARYKGYMFGIIVLILSMISIIVQTIDRKSSMIINSTELKGKDDKIAVYVTGAVKNPGVYYLDENSRVNNLLDICGGVKENADISQINLAKRLVDSDKIIIPIKQEKVNYINEETENLTKDINTNSETVDIDINEKEKININTAAKEKLMTLTGIGEVTAQKIIEYRNKQEFLEIEDIMNVPGIGMSKYENIKNNITTN